jgi:hypothetical protein
MKNIFTGIIVLLIVTFVWIATPARAEQVLTFKPDTVTVLKDKNGNDYVRMLVSEKKASQGVNFTQSTTINAYRDLVPAASKIKPGQEVTAVVEKREYQGRSYFTVLGIKDSIAKK